MQVLVPSMSTFEGAVMVADISGFTHLTELLSRKAHSAFGVELLTKCINSFFSKVRRRSCCAVLRNPDGTINPCVSVPPWMRRLVRRVQDLEY